MLLVIDQAEELLTHCGEQERAAFLRLLTSALRDNPRLWVVATLRSEFLTGLLTSGFADLFRNPMVIGSLDRAALFQVIEGPAAQAGLTFAPGVVNELVDDTGGGDALPLLAYTLQALYLRVGPGGTVTAEDCRVLGGVAGALSLHADKVAAELAPDVPVLTTLLRFVTIEGTEPTRRRVRRGSLSDAECLVVDAFVTARLLTSDADGDDDAIEVAHEALFRQWPPLRQAIEARADDLRQRAELERWAQDWAGSGHRDSYLLRDERLEIAQQWAATNSDLATELPLVHEFLARSTRSDRAALERLSESAARRALASVDQDPELAVLLALAAIEECASTRLAHRALLAAITASRVCGVLRGHEDAVRDVAWSPDGQRIATALSDHTARVWDAETGIELIVLRGHDQLIRGVAWSPDGQHLATASSDRTARIWDAQTGIERMVLHGHEDGVRGVAWSPDGQRLATASYDRTARIWDAKTGTKPDRTLRPYGRDTRCGLVSGRPAPRDRLIRPDRADVERRGYRVDTVSRPRRGSLGCGVVTGRSARCNRVLRSDRPGVGCRERSRTRSAPRARGRGCEYELVAGWLLYRDLRRRRDRPGMGYPDGRRTCHRGRSWGLDQGRGVVAGWAAHRHHLEGSHCADLERRHRPRCVGGEGAGAGVSRAHRGGAEKRHAARAPLA